MTSLAARPLLAAAFALTVFPCFAQTRTHAPGANAAQEAAFVRAIGPGATLAQIKALAPKGTRFGKPRPQFDDEISGTLVAVSGPIRGDLLFLSPAQERALRGQGGGAPERIPFRPADPVRQVRLIMDDGKTRAHSDTLARIRALSRFLGLPDEKRFYREDEVDFGKGGWYAAWRMGSNKTVVCGYTAFSDEAELVLLLEDRRER